MTFLNTALEYDPSLLAFEHNGLEVRNPFLSPDGLSVVDPVIEYGFKHVSTGGGCEALFLRLPCGGCIILTDSDGCGLPSQVGMADALIGRWNEHDEELACMVLGMVPLLPGALQTSKD